MNFYPNMRQDCKKCPANEISVNGGFIIDAKMDDEEHLSGMMKKHFVMACLKRFIDNSTEFGCDTW